MQSQVIRCREFALARLEEVLGGSEERGQGMVEYALILVLIAVVVIVIPRPSATESTTCSPTSATELST